MKHGHVMPSLKQLARDVNAEKTGAADDQDAHCSSLLCVIEVSTVCLIKCPAQTLTKSIRFRRQLDLRVLNANSRATRRIWRKALVVGVCGSACQCGKVSLCSLLGSFIPNCGKAFKASSTT